MTDWPPYPSIYEINTWTWLRELGESEGRPVTLDSVPTSEWDRLTGMGFDAVWLMGVWERSPAGVRIALGRQDLRSEFQKVLPDFREEDVVGSPYCVRDYVAARELGGPEGLAVARKELAERGIRLILDYVPNHVATDHAWIEDHPEYFIRGDAADLERSPEEFFRAGPYVIACGRDPYFPPWTDVAQLNAFHPGLRAAAVETLLSIAAQCDGVRCDMAMLLLNEIFERTWGARAGSPPTMEFWVELIGTVWSDHPDFLFIAEAYWDLEWVLQRQGFYFCYDKKLYDRLVNDSAEHIRLHLLAGIEYQRKLIRFVENHDEPRVASVLETEKNLAAGAIIATLPGARLLHEGQLEGRKVRLPVQLGRRPAEPVDLRIREFYRNLLKAIDEPVLKAGEWSLCERSGWPDNPSFHSLLAWRWDGDGLHYVIVVNYAACRSQGRVAVGEWSQKEATWRLKDMLSGEVFERKGEEMHDPGLFVDLGPWEVYLLRCEPGSEVGSLA